MVFLERLRQPVVWGVLGLALLAGSLAFGFTYAKYHALEFDAVDYSFYLVSAERIGHPSELQQLSINPHGYDIFRFYGTEGTRSLHQSIHFEPVKYLYALLLRLIDAPATLFAFVAFVCVLPLLYLVLAVSGQTLQRGAGRRFVLCLALLYALNPLLYLSAADDLRPFVFLPPLFLATFIAIRCKRPLWEQVFCLCLLLLVREEALFLGVILLGVASTLHARMRDTLALATPWLLWVCATTAFYWWDGYPNNVFGAIRHHLSLATVAVLGCVAIVLGVWYLSRKVVLTGFLRRVLLLSILFAGVGLQFLRFHLPPQYLLLHPFAWLLWIILACLALEFFFEYVAYSERRRGESQTESVWWQLCKKYAAGTCILLAALFLFVDLFFSVGPYHLWQSYRAAAPNNAARPRTSRVICCAT